MVLLIQKFNKFYSRLDNHHQLIHFFHHHQNHHESEFLSASLETFVSTVSNSLNQLSLNSKPRSEILSFPWIRRCFQILPLIHRAFSKLVADIEYPRSECETALVNGYLTYSLNLLDLFNSMSSSLSHLVQSRLQLSHGLSLVKSSPFSAVEHLKPIKPRNFNRGFKDDEDDKEESGKEEGVISKESIINQALMIMKGIGLWVCGIMISGLYADANPCLETRKSAGKFKLKLFSFNRLDLGVREIVKENGCVLKEIRELNDAVKGVVDAIINGKGSDEAAEEMGKKLEVFEKEVEGLGKEVNFLFSEVLERRNQLLDRIRTRRWLE